MNKSWKIRRIYLFSTSIFSMIVILYTLINEINTTPADTAVNMSFVLLISSVASYVFGAVWDDK